MAVAVTGLSQFSIEQQARLVLLRQFVQEARMGYGSLRDDLAADTPDTPAPATPAASRRLPRVRPSLKDAMLVLGAALVIFGIIGVVRTNAGFDDLQRSTTIAAAPTVPLASRVLPGVIATPGKYLSAVNGGGAGSSSSGASGNALYAVRLMWLKEAMDRWEALVGIGLSLLLFVGASRQAVGEGDATSDAATSPGETSVASDMAPFVLVAALLVLALSFFELP